MIKKVSFLIKLVFILLLLIPVSSQLVYAHPLEEVLGESTSNVSQPSIPPTSEGPGLVLPNSPLYFLDQLKQQVRLVLAFTPEAKAKVYASVAGERLAELRLMLVKNDREGVRKAIEGVADNFVKASNSLADAELTGRDISQLAEAINTDIKEKQQVLDELESQAGLELKPRVAAVTRALLGAKIKAENYLPTDKQENEVRDDVNRLIAKRLIDSSTSMKKLDKELNVLQNQASESSRKSITNREEALRKAIATKNEKLIKVQEKLLEAEKKRLQTLLELQKKLAEQARQAAQKVEEATLKYKQLQAVINSLRSGATPTTTTQ